jgi:hypothetical protein
MGNIITPDPSYTAITPTTATRYDLVNSRLTELLNAILSLNSHHNSSLTQDGLLTLNNNLKLKDVDASPVGDLILKVIDQILYIRNSGDTTNQKLAIECLLTAVANGLATLDANTRLVQAATTAWDGTGARSFSPTPAANTVPVRDSYSTIDNGIPPEDYKIRTLRDFFAGGSLASGVIGELGWRSSGTTSASANNGESGASITTTASSGNTGYVYLATNVVHLSPLYKFTAILRCNPGELVQNKLKCGFPDGAGLGDGDKIDVNGIYFHATNIGSAANWFAVSRSASVETSIDTGIAVGTTTASFKIVRRTTSQDGVNDIRFYINDSLVATITTNIPSTELYPGFVVETSEAVAKSITARYFYIRQNLA